MIAMSDMENDKQKSDVQEIEKPEMTENVQQEVESEQKVEDQTALDVDVQEPISEKEEPAVSGQVTKEEPSVEDPNGKKQFQEDSVEPEGNEDEVISVTEATPSTGTEEDSSDNEGEEQEEQEEIIDFHKMDKSQIVAFAVELKGETDIRKMDQRLKAVKERYDELFGEDRNLALEKFLGVEGNAEEDFEFKGDGQDDLFEECYRELRTKRNQFFKSLEKERDDNLKTKTQILEDIRQLVDGEETDSSISKIRELQDQWKKTGPVPGAQNKTLWANYNALLDRFYDARSIYFELKDLDRKKNLKLKTELCDKAEELDKLDKIQDAVSQLNELHDEFKHIGPVPKDDQEPLWQRFKTASDKIYVKRRGFVDELKKELHSNLEKKIALVEEVRPFIEFKSEKITDWNAKTKEVLALQDKWNAIGGMPRDKAKEVNKSFWSSFKQYFANKNAFYKELDSHKDENLVRKMELVEKAESLKESTDWNKTSEELKKIQAQWREIGPVPDESKKEVFKRFKDACDQFFSKKRAEVGNQHKEFEENYKKKSSLCDNMSQMLSADTVDLEKIYEKLDEYMQIGFVPRKVLKKMHKQFDDFVDSVMTSDLLTDDDKNDFQTNLQLAKAAASGRGDNRGNRKEGALKRKITNLENDINTYKTNIDFFAASKNADKLKLEFEEKINQSIKELDTLKKQLRELRS